LPSTPSCWASSRTLRERYGVTRPSPVDPEAHAPVSERIAILRGALDELELELEVELALGSGASPDRFRS